MSTHATARTLTVTALHTFRAGGGAHLIPKGSHRRVVLPPGAGLEGAAFWTEDQRGQRFPQLFRLGVAHGWQVVTAHEAAGHRHASVPPWTAPARPIAPGPAPTSQSPGPALPAPAGPLPAPPVPAHPRAKGEPLAETLTDAALLVAMGAGLGVLGPEGGGSGGGSESESEGESAEPEDGEREDDEWP